MAAGSRAWAAATATRPCSTGTSTQGGLRPSSRAASTTNSIGKRQAEIRASSNSRWSAARFLGIRAARKAMARSNTGAKTSMFRCCLIARLQIWRMRSLLTPYFRPKASNVCWPWPSQPKYRVIICRSRPAPPAPKISTNSVSKGSRSIDRIRWRKAFHCSGSCAGSDGARRRRRMRPNISPTVSDSVSIARSRSPRRGSLNGIRRIFAIFPNAIASFDQRAIELRRRKPTAGPRAVAKDAGVLGRLPDLWPARTDASSDGLRRTPRQLADRPETLPKTPEAAAFLPRSSCRDLAVGGQIPRSSKRFACVFPDRGRPAFDHGEWRESASWPAPTTCGPPGQPPGPLAGPVPDKRRAESGSTPLHQDHTATSRAARDTPCLPRRAACGNPQHVSEQLRRHGSCQDADSNSAPCRPCSKLGRRCQSSRRWVEAGRAGK